MKNMTISLCLKKPYCFPALLLAGLLISTAPTTTATDYSVGDRLPSAPAKNAGKATPPATPTTIYKEITWDDLMPKNWDPMAPLKGLKLDNLRDGDPRAIEALEKIREAWSNAPIEPALNGARIRLPGFAIPLEKAGNKVSEFLLVPYFGACIHTPPPPSNQIIHVTASKPITGMRTMDTVWVSGVMHAGKVDTEMGQAGYQLKAEVVVPYK